MPECALSEWRVHHRMLTSNDKLVQSALGLGCGSCTKSVHMKFGTKDMLYETVFGWGMHCCLPVCRHGNGVAHSLNVSTSLVFFPKGYAEAFEERCNSGTNGTEELGDARSNKGRMDLQCRTLNNICTVNARMCST